MDAAQINVRLLPSLIVVLVVARLLSWLATKVGQPRVNGEILTGLILGPSIFGAIWPTGFNTVFPIEIVEKLSAFAHLGLILYVFLIGLEIDLMFMKHQVKAVVVIGVTATIVPLALGIPLGLAISDPFNAHVPSGKFALFIGVSMAVTAFPVLARILQETRLDNTKVGSVTIASAAVCDVVAWCALAGIISIIKSNSLGSALQIIALLIIFLAGMFCFIEPLVNRLPIVPLWLAITIALSSAFATEKIGLHAIFGALTAGIAIGSREPKPWRAPKFIEGRQSNLNSQALLKAQDKDNNTNTLLESSIRPLTLNVFLPIFFVVIGMSVTFKELDGWIPLAVTIAVISFATVSKWGSTLLASRLMGHSWHDASTIGILMNTRGLTELVILTIGLEQGIISQTVFSILVIMAISTTMMTTPLLRITRAIPRHV